MKKKSEEKPSNNNKSEKGKELKESTKRLEARIDGIMTFIPLSSVKWNSNE